jgi:hypothetical protein
MQTKMTASRVPGAMIMKSIFPFNARVPYGHMTRVSPDRKKKPRPALSEWWRSRQDAGPHRLGEPKGWRVALGLLRLLGEQASAFGRDDRAFVADEEQEAISFEHFRDS